MQKKYTIDGMTCGACVARIKERLSSLPEVLNAEIQLKEPQATLTLSSEISIQSLQKILDHYSISEIDHVSKTEHPAIPSVSFKTYKPLLLIIGFIIGVTVLTQYPFQDFSFMLWMRHFMAGFFIVFAFFKLLNLSGFASSYRMYDVVAAKWNTWGYIYPFVELSLGLLYLTNIAPIFTNWATIVILGISSIGVIQSNLNKRKVKCACLGDVFNLPMSTVTIVEDVSMVLMAVIMLLVK